MPVPISCVPTRTSTRPSRCAIACASGPDTPTACHAAHATPIPRRIGPAGFWFAAFFSSHPKARAPNSNSTARTGIVAVAAAKLETVEVELARHLVHRQFQREASLRPSGRAHRRRRPGVHEDVAFLGAEVGASIDQLERPRAARSTADPAAAMLHQIDRGQLSRGVGAQRDFLIRARTVAGRPDARRRAAASA